MISQRHCPYCKAATIDNCPHLALAIEGRSFVQRCIELCQGQKQWQALCAARKRQSRFGSWSADQEDFMWLETAFCNEFLRRLRWFGGMDHEWRSGDKPEQGGFVVIVWSRNPQRMWWELRDEFSRQLDEFSRKVRVPSERIDWWPTLGSGSRQGYRGPGLQTPI